MSSYVADGVDLRYFCLASQNKICLQFTSNDKVKSFEVFDKTIKLMPIECIKSEIPRF